MENLACIASASNQVNARRILFFALVASFLETLASQAMENLVND